MGIMTVQGDVDLACLQYSDDRSNQGCTLFDQQGDWLVSLPTCCQDRARHAIGGFIQLVIGESLVFDLDRNIGGVFLYDFLKPIRDRLLDFFPLELDERTRRVKALRSNGFLFRWKLSSISGELTHLNLFYAESHRHQPAKA